MTRSVTNKESSYVDPLNQGEFQTVNMFIEANEQESGEEKGCGSIHSRSFSVNPNPVIPTTWSRLEPLQNTDFDFCLTQVSALLQNQDSVRLMGPNSVSHRLVPGALKSTSDLEEDFPNLISESSLIKLEKYLRENLEHPTHISLEELDPLYYVPIVNWLFLRLQQEQLLTDHRACSLCQDSRIQKFVDSAIVQVILAIALVVFNFLKISAVIVVWNIISVVWEGARSSSLLDSRTLCSKEIDFLQHVRVQQ